MTEGSLDINLSIPLETITTLGFYGIAAIYIIFTAILYYHWQEYSIDKGVTKTTFILYLATTLPIFILLGISTLQI